MLIKHAKSPKGWLQRAVFGRSARLLLVLVMLTAVIVSNIDWAGTPSSIAGPAEARDGDSLVIGQHRVRLLGIDAPEREQTCKKAGKSWRCGRDAQRHLARLIGNHDVDCAVVKRDRFDRLLARCRAGQRDLNQNMVRDGMAVAFSGDYRREETQARREKVGLWAGEFQRPQQWRRQNGRR